MDFHTTMNPYERYSMTEQRFRDAVAKKKDMEEHFHPSMVKEYSQVKHEMVKSAIELLKLGVASRLEDQDVFIILDDDEYIISRADMMKAIDKKQWDDLFPNDNIQTIKAEIDDGTSEDEPEEKVSEENYNQYENTTDVQSLQNNPMAAFFTALFAPFAGAAGGQQPDMNKMALSLQQAFQPPQELSDEVGSIQKKILRLEKQRDTALEDANRSRRQLAAIQESQDEVERVHKEELEEVKKGIDELKSQFDDVSSKLEETKKKLGDKEKEFQQTLEKERNSANRQLQDEKKRAKEQADELNKKLDEAKADNSSLKKKLDEQEKKASEVLEASVQKIRDDAEAAAKKAKNEIQDLKKKLDDAEERARKAADDGKSKNEGRLKDKEKEISSLKDTIKELNEKLSDYDDMKEVIETSKKREVKLNEDIENKEQLISNLEALAYHDRKAGILNNNAFNRDFPGIEDDKDNTCLVITGVRNMRVINDKYGRAAGDQMLKVAADACKSEFGETSVYRVFNDEFAIISKDNFKSIIKRLESVRDVLSAQQINIVYGVAEGSKAENIKSMVSTAEDAMLQMKDTPMGAAPVPDKAPEFGKKKEEPEEVDMSDMLAEYMNAGN